MKVYDWIVIGGGITGAALGYELCRQGLSVLILEQHPTLEGATRYSYGGLAYWSGTSRLTRVLCQEAREIYQSLSEELETDTQFRELDLLLTIDLKDDSEQLAADYARCATPPTLVSVADACALEPLLNRNAIAGAFTVRQGHIHPGKTTQGYLKAFRRCGGEIEIARVVELVSSSDTIKAVKTVAATYHTANTVVCAGGLSRTLLKASGIPVYLYFTHEEMIETPRVDIKLQTIVIPADTKRFQLEQQASNKSVEHLWNKPGHEVIRPILDAGAVQFLDGSLRMGQLSRVLTDPYATIAPDKGEAEIRTQVGKILPALEKLPGTWHHCLVAFSNTGLPVVGSFSGVEGVYIFSGFTNPLVCVPPLAKRFANWVQGEEDEIIAKLSPAN
ncbi:FAD-dependent oxidoreductase [Moorena producens PAL-8-15-08-1]|uniref:FAD-dependent oxidoreductase n=1 Tax=Moorena producens PAL-8-15-08-1 TaxID=1458985 RepID=A0A1D8TNI6_9CYAN|nr:FAD-binding oxidoreductase [Moorena producens]AOW99164.1 FAD-dependent oxidoreductase [Moorena producens PAL-8-15-08-1]